MGSSVFFYQAAIVGSIWYFTSSYGWLGYVLALVFWAAFTFFRTQTLKLGLIQYSVLLASGYVMWEAAYADLLETAKSAEMWLLAGTGVIGIVSLVLVFRWLSGVVYANMSRRIEEVKGFLAKPKLEPIKDAAKSGALAACGISDILDTNRGADASRQNQKQVKMLFLNVPYSEKDEAKALGARWDGERRKWYIPDGAHAAPFARWINGNDNSAFQPRAGKTAKPTASLFVDLVPRTAWFSNLRSEITNDEWVLVKKATFEPAGYACQACGGGGAEHPVECHERWHYDSTTKVQTLLGTIALCPACHEATHFGLARVRGRDGEALRQMMRVNGWDESQTMRHVRQAMDEWVRRSEIKWRLDARWLLDFVPLSEGTRKKIADHASGIAERAVLDWQAKIIDEQKMGLDQIRGQHKP